MFRLKPVFLTLVLSLFAVTAQAATILDTLSTNSDPFDFRSNPDGIRFFNIDALGPLGQSFTLDADTENLSVSAFLSTFGTSANVTGTLRTGTGTGGTTLGSDTVVLNGISRNDAVLSAFDFSALGTLTAGTYTIVFSGTGTLGGGDVQGGVGLDTPGTDAFGPSGPFDFRSNPAREFGVLVQGDAVAAPIPLPAGAVLLASGVGLLLLRRRKTT
ncbi:MAG: hypothetical protein AAF727_01045 [Pseudomonadota bacterium]